jgi:hypothetical protein
MRRTITVYTCDHANCGKELKTADDGLVLDGFLHTPDNKHALRSREASRAGPGEPHALCWDHFHQLFPSPQSRAYEDEIRRSYERGGPGDR